MRGLSISPVRRVRQAMLIVAGTALSVGSASGQEPWWLDSLDYTEAWLSPVRVGSDGFPYLPVRIDGTTLWLLFDTGNMVGLTVATPHFDQLGLPRTGTIRQRDSNGELVGVFRVGEAQQVDALGQSVTQVEVREFSHPRLAGLFGPGDLPGTRFTLDYQERLIAVDTVPIGRQLVSVAQPLIRSPRHPRLIVVQGDVRGEPVLIELDTGKSRTVVDPVWATGVGLTVDARDTVVVGEVRIGQAVFHIADAKPFGLGAIDPDLPAPLVLSLGSDSLSRFVLTVDYRTGSVLLWEAR